MDKEKVIAVHDKLVDTQSQLAEKDRQIAELVRDCDTLAEEVARLGKPNEGHNTLVEVVDTQKAQLEKLIGYCEDSVEKAKKLKTTLGETN